MKEQAKPINPVKPPIAPNTDAEKAKEQLSGTDPKVLSQLIRRILENDASN